MAALHALFGKPEKQITDFNVFNRSYEGSDITFWSGFLFDLKYPKIL